jgi:hypothetical protein
MTLFLLSHTLPDLHDLSTRALLPNRRLRLISPFGLREFQLSTLASSTVLPPEVDDLSTRVPHRSTTCGSLRLFGLREFQLSVFAFSWSAFTRRQRSVDACPSQIDGCGSLRSSGFGSFNSQSSLSPGVLSPKTMICRHVSLTDRRLWFTSALQASGVSTLRIFAFSRSGFTRSSRSLTRVLLNRTTMIYFGSSGFGSFNSSTEILEVTFPRSLRSVDT